mmetsp:Transcript_25798/g.48092  ORF Transcript_25798/g.48092 Transcript_25798/m.48092 type:complete len:303 (-) Transcript_25798:96-1004(-)
MNLLLFNQGGGSTRWRWRSDSLFRFDLLGSRLEALKLAGWRSDSLSRFDLLGSWLEALKSEGFFVNTTHLVKAHVVKSLLEHFGEVLLLLFQNVVLFLEFHNLCLGSLYRGGSLLRRSHDNGLLDRGLLFWLQGLNRRRFLFLDNFLRRFLFDRCFFGGRGFFFDWGFLSNRRFLFHRGVLFFWVSWSFCGFSLHQNRGDLCLRFCHANGLFNLVKFLGKHGQSSLHLGQTFSSPLCFVCHTKSFRSKSFSFSDFVVVRLLKLVSFRLDVDHCTVNGGHLGDNIGVAFLNGRGVVGVDIPIL